MKFEKEIDQFFIWAHSKGYLIKNANWNEHIVSDFQIPSRNKMQKCVEYILKNYQVTGFSDAKQVLADFKNRKGSKTSREELTEAVTHKSIEQETTKSIEQETTLKSIEQETTKPIEQETTLKPCDFQPYVGFDFVQGTLVRANSINSDIRVRIELVDQFTKLFNKAVTLDDIEWV